MLSISELGAMYVIDKILIVDFTNFEDQNIFLMQILEVFEPSFCTFRFLALQVTYTSMIHYDNRCSAIPPFIPVRRASAIELSVDPGGSARRGESI